jgi:hypothetical protein
MIENTTITVSLEAVCFRFVRSISFSIPRTSWSKYSGAKQLLMTAVVFAFGCAAAFKAYGEASRLWHAGRAEGVFNGLFLGAWGALFIGIAMYDLCFFLENRPKAGGTAWPSLH